MSTQQTEQATADPVVLAFMIADIRGYSRFSREHGDIAAAALAKRFADLAREAVEARGGTVVELRGDEAFAAFSTAAQAVLAATELQLTCLEEIERDSSLPLLVGVGIDIGPAVPVEDGYRGIAINLAARLCSAAGANQVMLTENAAEQCADLHDVIEFSPRGASTFKGFEDPVSVVEARSRVAPAPLTEARPAREPVPPELVDPAPLAGRVHEVRWLRGTWRQARRGGGRVVALSGPAGIGKTRLAADIAAHVVDMGGAIRYAGPGGLAAANAQASIREAATAVAPMLVVLDQADVLGDEVVRALEESSPELARRPVLVVLLLRDLARGEALGALIDRCAAEGGHRRLPSLSPAEVAEIVAVYTGGSSIEAPVEMIVRASSGVPALVHEKASEWARSEAARRLEAAAEFMTAVRTRRTSDLEFANNVIGLKLGHLYGSESGRSAADLDDVGPYKGLAAFDAEDAAWFFGREQLVGELAARLVGSGALAVLGASGSGKSSVVAAGLLPSLRAGLLPGSGRWSQVWMRPGVAPMTSLRSSVGATADDPLGAAVGRLGEDDRLLLVVDQFEEVFTSCADEEERGEFLSLLARYAAERPEAFALIATLRSDFYGHLAPYPQLGEQFADNHVLVGPLTRAELQRVVQLPAQRAGIRIEAALVDELVDEAAGAPGALPLLSTALVELWQSRSEGWIRAEVYREGGGIRGAVARLAEASYAQLDDADQAAARRVLLRLASASEGDVATRRRVSLDEFDLDRDVSARRVIERFTADRLLTVAAETVEVAHEALLREWPRLRQWLEEDVQGRVLSQHLTLAARGWDASGQERSELYRGVRLTAALEWSADHPADLNDLERAFLLASRAASEQEADAARRTNRRLRVLLTGAVVLLLVAAATGVVALVQRSSAQRASTSALADSLGAQAVSQPRLDRAMLLAREAVAMDSQSRTQSELLSTVLRAPYVLRTYHENLNRLNGIALSPDGKILALADNNDNVVVEDAATGRLLKRLATEANFVAFAPDGALLLLQHGAQTFTGFLRVDPRTGAVIGMWRFPESVLGRSTVRRDTGPVPLVGITNPLFDFAPGGTRAAVSMYSKNAQAPDNFIYQIAYPSGRLVGPTIKVPNSPDVTDFPPVAYGAGGSEIVTNDPSQLLVFSAATGQLKRSFAVQVDGRPAVAPTGKDLAFGAPDGSLRFVDLRTGRVRPGVGVVPGGVTGLTFADHGRLLITGGGLGAVDVWGVRSRHITRAFVGHAANIDGIAVSRDSSTLYTGSFDNTAIAWDLTGRRDSVPAFTAIATDPSVGAWTLALSPDGRTMAVGNTDGSVVLRDATSFARIATLPSGDGVTAAVSWSPNGRYVVVANNQRGPTGPISSSLRLFDVTDRVHPHLVRRLTSPLVFITWATFTHDGSGVLSSGYVHVAPSPLGGIAETRVSDGQVVAAPVPLPKGVPQFIAGSSTTGLASASGINGTFELVDVAHRRVVAEQGGIGELVPGEAFSPDGKTLAVADFEGKVHFLDARTGRVERTVQLVAEPLAAIAYSPDGRLIATTDTSDNTRMYDSKTLTQIGTTYAPPWAQRASLLDGNYFSYLEFSPDGSRLFASDQTGGVWVLPTSLALWESDACRIANRSFTPAEWSQYVGSRAYQAACRAAS